MNIVFSKDDHKYQAGEKVYTSVSKLISKYKNEFDSDHWSTYKAIEKVMGEDNFRQFKKGWDVSKEEFILHAMNYVNGVDVAKARKQILKEWDQKNKKSIKRGNAYHDVREKRSYKKGYELNPFDNKKYKIALDTVKIINPEVSPDYKENLIEDLYMLPDGYYPELLVWNEKCGIAGQADKVFLETIGNTRYVDIDDYKTNNKIKIESAYVKKLKGRVMMKKPLGHLMDCNHTHYNLQISTYAWVMEQFGFKVRNLAFHHYNKPYVLNYLKKEVEMMLETAGFLEKYENVPNEL